MRGLAVAIGLGALLLTGCGGPTRTGPLPAPAEELVINDVFVSPTGERALVQVKTGPVNAWVVRGYWLVDLRSGHAARSREPAAAGSLAWSPEGRSVAYLGHDGRLTVYDLERGGRRVLSPSNLECQRAAWSPDGRQVAFVASERASGRPRTAQHSTLALYAVPAIGRPRARCEVEDPAVWLWSADGKHLLYSSSQPQTKREQHLAQPLPAGRGLTRIGMGSGPLGVWSPDRSALAGDGLASGPQSGVTMLDAGLRPRFRVPVRPDAADSLVWSPDSRRLLFAKLDAKGGKSGIYVIDVPRRTWEIVQNPALEQARPVGWVKWAGKSQVLFVDSQGRRLLVVESLRAPAYTLARLREDGSLTMELPRSD